MSTLAKNNKQLIYIYSEDSLLGTTLLPFVEIADKAIRIINLNQESIADTIWVEIAYLLDKDFEDIFNSDNFGTILNASNFCAGDWLKLVNNNPSVLQCPIAINGNNAKILSKKADVFQFYNATGGGFDKTPSAIKYANHNQRSSTKGSH